jgi:hypothetical protein
MKQNIKCLEGLVIERSCIDVWREAAGAAFGKA